MSALARGLARPERLLLNRQGSALLPTGLSRYLESLRRATRIDPSRVIESTGRALDLARRVNDRPARALLHRARAHAHRAGNRYAEAVADYRRALRVFEQLGLAEEGAVTRIGLLDALIYLARYDEARAEALAARRWFQRSGDGVRRARVETNLGNLHHRLDEPATALAWYDRARGEFRRRRDDASLALVEFNRGNVLAQLGRLRAARQAYEAAGSLFARRGLLSRTAQVRYNAAYLRFLENQLPEALEELEAVRPAFEKLGDERHLALTRLDEAEILLRLHLWSDAADAGVEALRRLEALAMSYEVGKAHLFIGLAALHQGHHDPAARSLERAGRLFAREGNRYWLGETNRLLARLALDQGDWSAARTRALAARTQAARLHRPEAECAARLMEARAERGADHRSAARRTLARAVVLARRSRSPWLAAEAHELSGLLAREVGENVAARRHFRLAIRQLEQLRALLSGDDLKAGFLRDRDRPYLELAALELSAGRPRAAFEILERGRARALLDLLTAGGPARRSRTRRRLEEMALRLLDDLGRRYHQAEVAESSGRRLIAPDATAGEEKLRDRLEAEAARALRRLDRRSVGTGRPGASLISLQRLLRPGETVLAYFELGGELGLFAIDRHRFSVHEGLAPVAEVTRLADLLRFQWGRFRFDPDLLRRHAGQLDQVVRGDLRQLGDLVLAPVANRLDSGPLIIVPTAALRAVPFAALFDGRLYLAQRRAVVVAPSAAVFAAARAASPGRTSGRGPVVLMGVADERAPQVADEIRELRRLWPEAVTLEGPEATVESFRRLAPRARILHLATHGVFRTDRPNLSGVRLGDRWLYGYDVARLALSAELVTLSACVTGLSAAWGGGEWMGLARSFLSAGARRVLVGLWDVDDAATRQLMGLFYQSLLSEEQPGPAESLARAQAQMASSGWHPYYWSGFSLLGDV